MLRRSCSLLKGVYSSFRASLVWWSLLVMVVESNIMKLTFDCFIQIQLLCHFSFPNKVNSAACTAVVFVFVFYCFAVYPLCFRYCKKKHSEIFLVRTQRRLSSFFVEPLCSVARNFFRAAVQALLLQHYSAQILALAIIDSLFLLSLLFFRKSFVNNLAFVGTLAVASVYFTIDLVLCLYNRKIVVFEGNDLDTFLYNTMIALVSCILFVSAITLF